MVSALCPATKDNNDIKSKTPSTIYIRVILAMMAMLVITSVARSQTKIVERSRDPANARVELVHLKSQDQPLKFGESFEGGPGWLKELSFSVKNTSQKNIVHISIAIDFTEIKAPHIFRHDIVLGRPTNTKCCKHLPLLTLKPGESLSVSLSEEYKKFGETVEKYYGADALSTITIMLGQVHFEDGTRWNLGEINRPDPDRPGYWLPIE